MVPALTAKEPIASPVVRHDGGGRVNVLRDLFLEGLGSNVSNHPWPNFPVALEHPEIWGAIIDLDESLPAVLAARSVLAEADAHDGEDQVVYRAGVRHVPRLQRHTPQSPQETHDG